jgi:two-component system KDP operon response regulator KdpE
MSHLNRKILIVEPDVRITEMLVESLTDRFDARVTCTARAEDALDIEIVEPHDLALADFDLPGLDGLELASRLMDLSDRPVILTSGRPTLSQAIEALRIGVADYLPKPFAIPHLLNSVADALATYRKARERDQRYHRLRRTVRRVLKDRRELSRRIDLVCRDLVGAHRRLVHRVLETEHARRASG